jgi:hypothetical protein
MLDKSLDEYVRTELGMQSIDICDMILQQALRNKWTFRVMSVQGALATNCKRGIQTVKNRITGRTKTR